MIKSILLVNFLSFFILIFTHIIVFNIKFFSSFSRQSLYIRLCIIYILIFLGINFIFFKDYYYVLYNNLTLIIFSYCYFHIFNMALTARRINFLCLIYATKNISYDELTKIYSPESMINIRINRLLSNKWIYKDSCNILHIKSSTALLIANTLNYLRLKFF